MTCLLLSVAVVVDEDVGNALVDTVESALVVDSTLVEVVGVVVVVVVVVLVVAEETWNT